MREKKRKNFPGIGLRIVKSATAVFLCFLFYFLFRKDGIVFYSQLSALWCIQPHRDNTVAKALQRTVGTMIGAIFGLAVILIDSRWIVANGNSDILYAMLVSVAIIPVIYATLLLHKTDASYFSCVVFLSIVVNHIADANPYQFVWARVVDTMIGIAAGMLVNGFHLPRGREKDILFVSGMDQALLAQNERMTPYSLVELNRMLADGANFTVSTMRTPASLMEALRGVQLKLPVIAMDGAVMYDIKKNEYLHAYVLSKDIVTEVMGTLDSFQVNYFVNAILDNTLMIHYTKLENEAEKDIYEKLHTSPYRNYTTCPLLDASHVVYIMVIQQKDTIAQINEALQKMECLQRLKVKSYDSDDYPGYAYIKIYNENASRKNMIQYLQKETGLQKVIRFGSIPGECDIVIEESDHNKVVKTLKKMYEPLIWKRQKNKMR
ncbi:MAG: HAD hydrolase family protein [Lachnospiraceae bacterium]|nr:HAD hydrolase family protein [Lachnospiraceae bacterium]